MSLPLGQIDKYISSFPRSRGDEPTVDYIVAPYGKFSPLTRG